jgi:diguanylate cyclase (GGDEF)-like protein
VRLANGELGVTISVGVTTQPSGTRRSIDELMREADDALYRSKRDGRNRVTVFAA